MEEPPLMEETSIDYWSYCLLRIEKLPSHSKNKNYMSNYKRYIKWIEASVYNVVINVEIKYHPISNEFIFITQHNVEQYFANAVINYNGLMSTIRNHLNALIHFRTHYEYQLGIAVKETEFITHYIAKQ